MGLPLTGILETWSATGAGARSAQCLRGCGSKILTYRSR